MAGIQTEAETKLVNETFFAQLETPGMQKQAVDAVNDFTRTKMREDGFQRRILPFVPISYDELDAQVDTDNPVKVVEKEPDSPAAVSVPFNKLPSMFYVRGPKYKVTFARVVTPRFTGDVAKLRTWRMDIRQVLSDNSIKDMLAEEDSKFIVACNNAMVGQNAIHPVTGVAHWQSIAGGVTRENLAEALKIQPQTPSRVETGNVLVNNITIKDVFKFGRTEIGGDMSQDILKNGWTYTELFGVPHLITIKQDLVPTDTEFLFSETRFLGKAYELEAPTMFVKAEAWIIDFFSYESIGVSLIVNGTCRADFV